MKDGKAVACAATVKVNFRLVDGKGQLLPFEAAAPETGGPSNEPKVEASAPKPSPEPVSRRVAEERDSGQGDRVAENAPRKEGRDVDFFGSPQTDLRKSTNKLRLRTENFELVTDWREEDQLGQLLFALERARALFLHLYNQVPTGVVKVFVNQSLEETRSACQTSQGIGCYSSRSGTHSIILSKDAFSRGTAAPAVHEYTHLTQNLMGYASAPPWVNEGIAGYYEAVEFKQGKLYVGYFDPQRRIPAWFSVDAILTMDYATLKARLDLKGTQGFYAQSHLLLHMLRHTPRYSARLGEFLGAIKNGKDSREAVQQFFGISTSQLNVEFVEYYRRGKYQKVEVYEGIKVPNTVIVEGSSGQTLTVKERKCTWCGVRRVMRHMPIIIPIP
jgi:hypothetical protein